MGHYGKHIIDPDTGLCEICDRGAIHEFRLGKRPGKQFLYSNQDGKFTYRPADETIRNNSDDTTPRYVRKPLHPDPSPIRTRPIVHEEPVVVRKKVPPRSYSPVEDIHHPPHARLATLYYVDHTGQMLPQNEGPPDEPRRRHVVQNHHSPPARPTRVVKRRAQTPPPQGRPTRIVQRRAQTPPPRSASWRSRPKRQNNSDTVILREPHRAKPHDDDYYYDQPTRKPELYYIETAHSDHNHTTINSRVHSSINRHPSSKPHYQGDTNRKQRQLEPIERKYYNEPSPPVARKVYKKLPTNRYERPEDEYVPNGRPARKVEKTYPSPRTYESSPRTYRSTPPLTNQHIRTPISNGTPSVYHIQSANEY